MNGHFAIDNGSALHHTRIGFTPVLRLAGLLLALLLSLGNGVAAAGVAPA
jgi:hypothetical protein